MLGDASLNIIFSEEDAATKIFVSFDDDKFVMSFESPGELPLPGAKVGRACWSRRAISKASRLSSTSGISEGLHSVSDLI